MNDEGLLSRRGEERGRFCRVVINVRRCLTLNDISPPDSYAILRGDVLTCKTALAAGRSVEVV